MLMHQIAWKLALVVAGGAAALAVGAWLAGAAWPLGTGLAAAVLLGGLAYAAAQRLVARRLGAARALLRHIRQFEFEALEAADGEVSEEKAQDAPADEAAGDELDALLGEIRRTGRVLAEELRELRKMENYRREFIGNVSHELRTPIFSVRGFAETLLDGALEDEGVRRSFVEKILRNADRLRHLARDLAEIGRIETGELKMTVTAFPLRLLVREVAESLEPVATGKGVALQERVPEGLPHVKGDRERLRQVLTNLVDNAVKYNEENGSVEVGARRVAAGAVKIYVEDDGIGVAPEHVERLTERFYRVDQSRSRSQGGTGLGLAIVKHILGAHGSELTVSSSPNRGSTFGFTLPAVSGEPGGDAAWADGRAEAKPKARQTQTEKAAR